MTNYHAITLISRFAVNTALIGQSGPISSLFHFFHRYTVKKVKYCADWSEWSMRTVDTESSK